MADKIFVGRRKTSVARIILKPGSGKVTVNGRDFETAFPQKAHRDTMLMPLTVTEKAGSFDLRVNVRGGGTTGQADAVKLGVARALDSFDEDLHGALKAEGLLTRDPRMVERKKYGRPKARKRFQFSKR